MSWFVRKRLIAQEIMTHSHIVARKVNRFDVLDLFLFHWESGTFFGPVFRRMTHIQTKNNNNNKTSVSYQWRAERCGLVTCFYIFFYWFVIVMQILSVGPVMFPQFSTHNFTIVSFIQMYSRTLLLCTIQFHYHYNDRASSSSSSFLPSFLSFFFSNRSLSRFQKMSCQNNLWDRTSQKAVSWSLVTFVDLLGVERYRTILTENDNDKISSPPKINYWLIYPSQKVQSVEG